MSDWRDFGGINEGYALELYERFLQDPHSVDPATRAAFERLGPPGTAAPQPGGTAAPQLGGTEA